MPTVTLDDLIRSWLIDLRGRNLSPKTVSTYGGATERLVAGPPDRCRKDVTEIGRDDLREYFARIAQERTPGGVSVDYRALQQFFKWADEIEEEITPNPMAKMRPPIVPSLRRACSGRRRSRHSARRVMGATSWRAVTSLSCACSSTPESAVLSWPVCKTDNVSTELREAYVMGKGRRARIVPFRSSDGAGA